MDQGGDRGDGEKWTESKGIQEVKWTGVSDRLTGHEGTGSCPAAWMVVSFVQKRDTIVGGGAGESTRPGLGIMTFFLSTPILLPPSPADLCCPGLKDIIAILQPH